MSFWLGRRVLVTGHTGFKGAWLSEWLLGLGAKLSGIALAPQQDQPLFDQLGLAGRLDHSVLDIRDPAPLVDKIKELEPEIVIHMAAQPLVLPSYADPLTTWATNVMGSAHVMEGLRGLTSRCGVVMVTTDKVYQNREWLYPYRESDRLGGHDPYSASKAAMELAISSWRKSFFVDHPVNVASARAGNVIGGGDWAAHRLVPDIVRALQADQAIAIRNPRAVRPFQHVLEPLSGYLRLAEALFLRPDDLDEAYNFGPEPSDLKTVEQLVEAALLAWPGRWEDQSDPGALHEAGLLSLGIEASRAALRYAPRWDSQKAVASTMQWYRDAASGADIGDITRAQIAEFGTP